MQQMQTKQNKTREAKAKVKQTRKLKSEASCTPYKGWRVRALKYYMVITYYMIIYV